MTQKYPSTPSSLSAQNEGQFTVVLTIAVFAATFGSSFQMGYHNGCINMPADLIKQWFTVSYESMSGTPITVAQMESTWAIAVGIYAVGGMFGGILVGSVADRLGRRNALLANNILAIFSTALMVVAKYVGIHYLVIVGRFVTGLNIGLNSGLAPMYLTEISPTNLRGLIGSLHQLCSTFALLISQIVGLPFIFGTADRWPLIFAFTMVPVLFQLCVLPFCPESPKFTLISKGQKAQADRDLQRLRGKNDVSAELEQINAEAVAAQSQPQVGMLALFRPPFRWPMVLGVFMMLSQQLYGINAAMYYSTSIFNDAGLRGQWPNIATIVMGTVQFAMTFVSVVLVERLGRRTLHITGLVGGMISSALIAASLLASKSGQVFAYFSILFVLTFVTAAAVGPGSIPWFFVNEILPLNARGSASSIAVLSNWGSNALVGFFFPLINEMLHEYAFFVFTALLALFIAFACKFMPETKNKSLAEVWAEMDRRRGIHRTRRSELPISGEADLLDGESIGKTPTTKIA